MGTPLKQDTSRPWSGSFSVRHEVAYWRKANAIHSWFVENVQDGRDECQMSRVPSYAMKELITACSQVLTLLNPFFKEAYDEDGWNGDIFIPSGVEDSVKEILMPVSGFFFGSTDINMYFYDTVRYTHDRLTEVLEWVEAEAKEKRFWEIYYRSSW